MIIEGKTIASEIIENLKKRVVKLKEKGITPTLAIILIGNENSSTAYVRQKELKAREAGVEPKVIRLEEKVTNQEVEALVKTFDKDSKIHGIILQRPAPEHIEIEKIEEHISPIKEVDGFGANSLYPVPVAAAALKMLEKTHHDSMINQSFIDWLKTKKIVVIGKGETGGETIINLLRKRGIEPLVVDSKTENKDGEIRKGDIVISAVGKKDMVTKTNLKKGAILIGVGIFSENGKTYGDYDTKEIGNIASYYSPTPGGVGPVNVAMLMENIITACENLSR